MVLLLLSSYCYYHNRPHDVVIKMMLDWCCVGRDREKSTTVCLSAQANKQQKSKGKTRSHFQLIEQKTYYYS